MRCRLKCRVSVGSQILVLHKPDEMDNPPSKPSLFERFSALLTREPEDRDQLLAQLHSAYERNLLDADALSIIEGALQVSDMQVRDAGHAPVRKTPMKPFFHGTTALL